MANGRLLLLAAGSMSVTASCAHLACIVGGPDWYRRMGAGERMARAVERGAVAPALITFAIAAVIAGWAVFAFSAAGIGWRLPFTRAALVLICAMLLARAMLVFAPNWRPDLSRAFVVWSSLIVLIMGLTFTAGTWLAWPDLSRGTR